MYILYNPTTQQHNNIQGKVHAINVIMLLYKYFKFIKKKNWTNNGPSKWTDSDWSVLVGLVSFFEFYRNFLVDYS